MTPDQGAGSARDVVLARVRAALATPGTHHARTDAPVPPTRPDGIPAPSTPADGLDGLDLLDLLVERVEDYRADVVRVPADGVAGAVARALEGCESVVVPTGLDDGLLPDTGPRLVAEGTVGDVREVEGVAAVVTTAAVAIAETGTIVLDHGPGQGRRGLTLLPDRHVCVVRADQVVRSVPEAVSALRASVEEGRPLTWVSGPSATSDIELDRVEGVHGPRHLHVVLVEALP